MSDTLAAPEAPKAKFRAPENGMLSVVPDPAALSALVSGGAPAAAPAAAPKLGMRGPENGMLSVVRDPATLSGLVAAAPQQFGPPRPHQSYLSGLTDQATHAFTFGLDDVVQPGVSALFNSALRSVIGGNNQSTFSQDYDRFQAEQRARRAQFAEENPVAAGGAAVAGGLGSAPMTAGLFGSAAPGASLGEQALTYGKNVAAGAGVGGAAGFGMGEGGFDNRLQGAEEGAALGGGLAAAVPAIAPIVRAAAVPFKAAASALSIPEIVSQGSRETAVGKDLARMTGGAPGESPVLPGVQYTPAQATNSRELAEAELWARNRPTTPETAEAKDAYSKQQTANNQAVTDAMTGQGGVAPAADTVESSTGLTQRLRQAEELAGQQEHALWSAGPLATEAVPQGHFKTAMQAAVDGLDPGLRLGVDGSVQKVLTEIAALPDTATVRDMNSFKSALQRIARNPGETNPQAGAVARRLASEALQAIDDTIAASNPTATLRQQYAKAREFTLQKAGIFETPEMRAATNMNSAGVYTGKPSDTAEKFFNLSKGLPEGPQTIQNVRNFLQSFQDEWTNAAAGKVVQQGIRSQAGLPPGPSMAEALQKQNPVELAQTRDALADHARSYVVSRFMDAAGLTGRDLEGSPVLSLSKLSELIGTNRKWMQDTGLFTGQQLDLIDRVATTADALRRPLNLKQGVNSDTSRNFGGEKYPDRIISPWLERIARYAPVVTGGYLHGLEGGAAGYGAGTVMASKIDGAREAIRTILVEAALGDQKVARDLMARATTPLAQLQPGTRDLLKRLSVLLPASAAGELAAKSTESTPAPSR